MSASMNILKRHFRVKNQPRLPRMRPRRLESGRAFKERVIAEEKSVCQALSRRRSYYAGAISRYTAALNKVKARMKAAVAGVSLAHRDAAIAAAKRTYGADYERYTNILRAFESRLTRYNDVVEKLNERIDNHRSVPAEFFRDEVCGDSADPLLEGIEEALDMISAMEETTVESGFPETREPNWTPETESAFEEDMLAFWSLSGTPKAPDAPEPLREAAEETEQSATREWEEGGV